MTFEEFVFLLKFVVEVLLEIVVVGQKFVEKFHLVVPLVDLIVFDYLFEFLQFVAIEIVVEYKEMKEELQELLNEGCDKEYIIKVARERWGLYFPDEEIFYNDRNE